jgi:hypothetical protein
MPAQRRRKQIIIHQMLANCRKRAALSIQGWDLMPAVGREFGSRDWARLYEHSGRADDLHAPSEPTQRVR